MPKAITVSPNDAAAILSNLRREYDAGVQHRRNRMEKWKKNDRRYNGDCTAPKRSLHNFHLPILSGFEDTLMAKIDEQPQVKFGSDQPGEKRLGKRYDSLYRQNSSRPGREWKMADLSSKRDAARYGRAIMKMIGNPTPFNIDLESVDPYDFYCDPLCGDRLSKARYLGCDTIFRTSEELQRGVDEKRYDKEAVEKTINYEKPDTDDNSGIVISTEMSEAMGRFTSMRLDGYGYAGVGQKSYRLVESGTTFKGKRMYCVWCPESNQLLRCLTMKEMFGLPDGVELWHVFSWAPFPDKKVFWSKAPDDDISDVAEFQRQTMMYAGDATLKTVWDTRLYDPEVFEPQDLIYQPGGLSPSKKGASKTGNGLAGAIHQMSPPSADSAFRVIENLDGFVGQKSGVTPDTQGQSSEQVLGIAQQNLEQVSDRMGLTAKWYQACYVEIGQFFLYLSKHLLPGKKAVQIIGADGYEFATLAAKEIDPSVAITVRGGRAEESMSAVKRREKAAAIADIATNPNMPKWAQNERLRLAGYEESEIRTLTAENLSTDQVDRANEAVEEILEGKAAKLYQGADDTFVKTVIMAAQRFTPSEGPEFDRLLAYAKLHVEIVGQNKAEALLREIPPTEQPKQPAEVENPMLSLPTAPQQATINPQAQPSV